MLSRITIANLRRRIAHVKDGKRDAAIRLAWQIELLCDRYEQASRCLTPVESATYDAICELTRLHGQPPTLGEIGEMTGHRSRPGVLEVVQSLREKKLLKPAQRNKSRQIVPA